MSKGIQRGADPAVPHLQPEIVQARVEQRWRPGNYGSYGHVST